MYDELVKRLRDSEHEIDCSFCDRDCCYPDGKVHGKCIIIEAADAIEELQKAVNFHKFNSEFWEDKYNSLADEKWIPVEEALPENNQVVVVVQRGKTWDYGRFRGLAYLGGNIHKWNWKNNTTKTVDYWMPKKSALPEPPKEG